MNLTELFGKSASADDGTLCIYPHETPRRTAAVGGYGPEPSDHFDEGEVSWTQARQYGAEDGMRKDIPDHKIGSVEEAQQLANRVTDAHKVSRVVVHHRPSMNYSFAQAHPDGGQTRIVLGGDGMNHGVLLHELAHHLDNESGAADPDEHHGDAFRGHFEDLLSKHHPNSYVARDAFRHHFWWTDQKMRDGVQARSGRPNPEMTEKEKSASPVSKHEPMWQSNQEHVEKANNALKWRSEPHGYLKYMKDYPELDYDSDEDYDRASAHMADEDMAKGLSPRLVPPHMLEAWVNHHPNPKAMEEPKYDKDGNDVPLHHTGTLTELFEKTAAEDHIGEPDYEEDDGYTRGMWDRWHPRLQPTIHRAIGVQFPAGHPANDASLPMHERAQAALEHVTQRGLGMHWTDDPDYHRKHLQSRLFPGDTPVVIHAQTPPRHHVEDNGWVHEDRAIRDWDTEEREVPVKRNAPLNITGITWGSNHHDFAEPINKRAAAEDTVRMVAPDEYRKFHFPDYPSAKTLPALVKHFKQNDGPYYAKIKKDIQENGFTTPVLVRYKDPRGKALKKPELMQGHHRAAVAHELGLHLPVGDFDNNDDFDRSNRGNSAWFATDPRGGLSSEGARVTADRHDDNEIHRAMSLVLPPDKHAFVHDEKQPMAARAHMLLSELKRQTPDIKNERLKGNSGGLGEFWSPSEQKAREFTNSWEAYNRHEREHNCGDEWSGAGGCPTTHVVVHADEPDHKHLWTDIYRDGEKYDRDVSWRMPLKPDTPLKVNGISWGEGDDHKPTLDQTYDQKAKTRYDFHSPVEKTAQYDHDHEWLPNGKYWGPNSAQNDQRLFVGSRLRPEVRQDILGRVGHFFDGNGYTGWQQWAKVYFAGSEAAKWAPFNGDFDVLIGIDWPAFRQQHPEQAQKNDLQVSTAMTDGLWKSANVDGYYFTLADGKKVGPFDRTFFVNPVAWDIKKIRPYAAYDVTADKWAVPPMQVPGDWSADKLPESYWDYAEALAHTVKAIGTLPAEERGRMARNLWEEIHTHRSDAFADGGHGLFDLSNVVEKYLDQHPDKLWDKLRAWKRGLTQEAALRSVKELDGADYTGVMIALVPPKEICEKLAVDGGEDVSTMHVTLAYLGGRDNHEADDLASLPDLVKAWAAHQKPLTASVGGVGTFVNPTQHVLWAHADIPHGTKFRDSLVSMLEEHGYDIRHDHGWVPHITLKYGKQPFRFMPKVSPESWDVDQIWVCIGGDWESFPIGG